MMTKHIRALRDNYLPALMIITIALLPLLGLGQTYGGEIAAKNNSNAIGKIGRVDVNLKVYDSAVLAKLNSGLTISATNLDIRDLTFAADKVDASGTVLGAGTNAIGKLAANSGVDIGDVDVTSLPSVTIGTFPDNEPFNVAQINGVTPLMGAGNGGTGSLRVNIATDQLAIPVTMTSTTITGSVAVTGTFWQATQPVSGTVTVTGVSTLAEQQTQTTALQLIDDVVYASDAAISKVAGIGGQFDDVSPGTTTENSVRSLRMSTRRELYNQIRDAAGNERGANVNASNELLVALSSVPSHAVTLASTTITGTVAVTKSGTWTLDANSGVDIGDVTINNASGGSAVNIQDGGNTITVDGTVAFSNTTIAVTNAGTFPVQIDGAALTALQLIDDNMVAQSTALGSTKNALMAGSVTTAAPSYTTGNINPLSLTTAGALRVDNSGVTQPVSGTVAISTTTIDVKSTTAPVSTMNSASANSGVNMAHAAVFDDVSPTAITENSFGFARMSANRNLYQSIRDAAGNERGANVTASNELLVSVNNASIAVTQATSSNLKAQVDPLTVATWGLVVEDATETAGGNLMGVGTVRRDVPASSAGATAENATLNTNSIGALWTSEAATADQSGYDKYYVVSGASTNAANIKATPGKIYGWYVFNANASARKIMFHNTSGTPTAGASTYFPLVIPASSGANVFIPAGINFSSGIGITMVTGTADADATGVAAGDLIVTILYK